MNSPYSIALEKELLTAVCVEGAEWFGEYMSREAAGRKGPDYLAGLAIGYIHFALDHPALFHLIAPLSGKGEIEMKRKTY